MCYLYAQSKKKRLYLHDTKNNISKEYHLILDTIKPIQNVEYTILNGITLQQLYGMEIVNFFDTLPKDYVRAEANRIFQWNEKTQIEINKFKPKRTFDCGVHVRTGDKITTGEMKAIAFDAYIQRIKEYQTKLGKDSLRIYLMTDSQSVIRFFNANKDPSWSIESIPSPNPMANGHDQKLFNSQTRQTVFQCFYHFLAEMQILQESTHIVCTFSSNIGRFLDLTKKGTIESLD
jgi:hypothetical protein